MIDSVTPLLVAGLLLAIAAVGRELPPPDGPPGVPWPLSLT